MLNIIYSYIFKSTRNRLNLTLKKTEDLTGIETSYLNKVENGNITPSDRVLNSFFKHLSISDEIDIELEKYIYNSMNKICASTFKNEKVHLLELIEVNKTTFYAPYLELLLFAISVGQEEYNDYTTEITNLLHQSIHQFADEFKRFFYIYYCQYLIKKHEVKNYEVNYEILKCIPYNQWKPMELYGQVIYYFHLNDLPKIMVGLENLQDALVLEKNLTLENALNSLYANYYARFNDYQKAIAYHHKSMDFWESIDDYANYGTSAWNIAWIYTIQNQYQNAINYWKIALKYQFNETVCFNLAWCYYSMNQKDLAINVITKSKRAAEVDQYHYAFIKWLKYHIKDEYCQKASKQLKLIYNDYFDTMTKDMQKFLLIALIKQAKYDQNHDDYYQYTDILIKTNINSLITM